MALIKEVKQWANTTTTSYINFLQVDTFIYWLINSINEFFLNLTQTVNNIYVADIPNALQQ